MAARGTHGFRFAVSAAGLAALLVSRGPLTIRLSADQAPVAARRDAGGSRSSSRKSSSRKRKCCARAAAGKGVTGTLRATLSDGTITHDASIQTIDESMREFRSNRGTEFNFVDSWRYNVAAYRLDRLLEIGMTPPSVERNYQNKPGAFTWWVDDVLMDEGARLKDEGGGAERAVVEPADVARAAVRSADLQRRSQSREPADRQAVDACG